MESEGRHYDCDFLPFMEIGSVAHKYYLINIRLPVNDRKGINVGIGEIKDIRLVVSVLSVLCHPGCVPGLLQLLARAPLPAVALSSFLGDALFACSSEEPSPGLQSWPLPCLRAAHVLCFPPQSAWDAESSLWMGAEEEQESSEAAWSVLELAVATSGKAVSDPCSARPRGLVSRDAFPSWRPSHHSCGGCRRRWEDAWLEKHVNEPMLFPPG